MTSRIAFRTVALLVGLRMTGQAAALAAQSAPVETAMRQVDFHIDSTLIMHIDYLRGRLIALRAGVPATFDDKSSFLIEMDTATIVLRMPAMGDLLNRDVFHYDGSPLHGLSVTGDSGRLKQSGRLHGLPFTIICDVAVTDAGELRLHPVSIKVLGIGAGGLMKLFGLTLQKLADVHKATGVRIAGNDLYLTPALLLPPPLVRGRLASAVVRDSSIALYFGGHAHTTTLAIPDAHAVNYMYFQGSTIRFGKLTMTPADLLVVDQDPRDPFDFWLARYQVQLVAGVSHTTASGGLITTWPDFRTVRR